MYTRLPLYSRVVEIQTWCLLPCLEAMTWGNADHDWLVIACYIGGYDATGLKMKYQTGSQDGPDGERETYARIHTHSVSVGLSNSPVIESYQGESAPVLYGT